MPWSFAQNPETSMLFSIVVYSYLIILSLAGIIGGIRGIYKREIHFSRRRTAFGPHYPIIHVKSAAIFSSVSILIACAIVLAMCISDLTLQYIWPFARFFGSMIILTFFYIMAVLITRVRYPADVIEPDKPLE